MMTVKMTWNTMMRATPTSKQRSRTPHHIPLMGMHMSITVLDFIPTYQADMRVLVFLTKSPTRVYENAEILANMGVNETGMGNVGDKMIYFYVCMEK